MDDLIAFEEVTIQQHLSELQVEIDACEDDHDARGELLAKRSALLGLLTACQDYQRGICDI